MSWPVFSYTKKNIRHIITESSDFSKRGDVHERKERRLRN
ncbi:hypothetical protein CHCC14809_0495 [Bacillus licheniformis]|nr:hypothetical protein B4089_3839 [Bacillus licheniformis]TWL26602.1 hypothetical protein CHCC16874_2992 [Bacillus licheniformis]TWL36578.1 hypothetical protein CHCC15543_2796 [Bacillus licheniformis]TWM81632.1 hypothetical protein CHCC14809_0495 [Bacillus licheniformis]